MVDLGYVSCVGGDVALRTFHFISLSIVSTDTNKPSLFTFYYAGHGSINFNRGKIQGGAKIYMFGLGDIKVGSGL